MRQMAFPFDYYSLVLKFKSIRFARDKNQRCFGFVVNGYTSKDKDVRRYLKSDGWTEKGYDNVSSFFSSAYVREKDGVYEYSRFLTTPITSFWIFPKMIGINTQDSEELLYYCNLDRFTKSLKRADKKLKEIAAAQLPKDEEEEEIKNEGNRVRRVAEGLFKLMLCYYKDRCHLKSKNYNDRLLGDVTSPLKKYVLKETDDETRLGEIARIANDLSHDTGNPVSYNDVKALKRDIEYYIGYLKKKVEERDYLKPVEDEETLLSPGEYIHKNFRSFNFSNEIAAHTTLSNAQVSFKIQIEDEPLAQSLLKSEHDWLCKDGTIKRLSEDNESEALTIYGRKEAMELCEAIHQHLIDECSKQGLDTELVPYYFSMYPRLRREEKPTYLFTEEDIKNLMINADDSQNNQLVIDEDGHACLIHNIGDGGFYPVSQETWCAGNEYVGPKSLLTDLHDSYVLSLHSWLRHLQSGLSVYDDFYVNDKDLNNVIEEIKKFY